jgi:hypothetical protein
MKFRNTLILLVVLAALGSYVYFFERNKEEAATTNDQPVAVLTLNSADIVSFMLVQGDDEVAGTKVRLARQVSGTWQLQAPAQDAADDLAVNNAINRLADLQALRLLEENPAEPSIYGLNPPSWTFVIGMQDGSEETLLVGDENPTQSGYFMQRGGSPAVYLVSTLDVQDVMDWATTPPLVPTPTPVPTATAGATG